MQIKIEVIPWKATEGQFGVSVKRGEHLAEAYLVGTRLEAEREAKRLRSTIIVLPGPKERRPRGQPRLGR
jgi:hypothetical protein